jgi:hypothetical protein
VRALAVSDKEARATARRLRPPGCGATVVRDFCTYFGDTYMRKNPAGRHVTGRRCPHCSGSTGEGETGDAPESGKAGDEGGGGTGSAAASTSISSVGDSGPREGRGWLLDSTVDFGECPGGFPWGANSVHNVAGAKRHMQVCDLVVVWGSSLSILANYFDPWHPRSKWAKPPPKGLRLAVSEGATAARPSGRAVKRVRERPPRKCRLAIINRGPTLDEELAALKLDADVDAVAAELLRLLGLPPPAEYALERDPLRAHVTLPRAGEPAAPWALFT